jgi:hypothetical protein
LVLLGLRYRPLKTLECHYFCIIFYDAAAALAFCSEETRK